MSKIILSLMLMFLFAFSAYAQGPGVSPPLERGVKYDDNGIIVPSPEEPGLTSPAEQLSKPFSAIRKWATGFGSKLVPGSQVPVQPELTEDAPVFVQEKREAYTVRIQEHREIMEQKRVEVQGRIEQQRIELRERLQIVQNEQKQRVVERIDEQITNLNERMVNHYLHLLERIGAVLTNIETRVDKAAERGLDVSAVREAIDATNVAINASHSAVVGQTGSTYTIMIEDEETLKLNVGAARQALHNDLKNVRDTVRAAHDATRSAAVTLAQIPRVDEIGVEEPAPTP